MKLRSPLIVFTALVVGAGAAVLLRTARFSSTEAAEPGSTRGGRLVGTYRTEPRTFNRYVSAIVDTELFARLTQATLVRVNRASGQVEPRLATDWTISPDGLNWTLNLRRDVTFSDGTPFTSADVLFTFEALYDEKAKTALAGTFRIGGAPLVVRALDAHRIVITVASPYAPGVALLDGLPILPRHKLRDALVNGAFRDAWTTATDPKEIVGLGPFVLQEYVSGHRMVFARNSRFWMKDEDGRALPYLDAIELQIVPEHNGEMLRLQSGEADLVTDRVRPEDIAALEALEKNGVVRLANAGVSISPEMFWFNLNPQATVAKTRPWLQRDELRLAISHAVDRQALVNTVYLGAATPVWGPITPGHGDWYVADLPRTNHDDAKARELLASIGLRDTNNDGLLDDATGNAARFTITTQKGHTFRERIAAVVQQEMRGVGLTVDVVPIERNMMIGQWAAGDYDAILFGTEYDTFDPARHAEFWLSSGGFHVWHPGQASPAREWEARIDALMREQMTTMDAAARRRLFADAQREFAKHLPVIYFAAPNVVVATSARLQGAAPSVLSPPVLWNAERLFLAPPDATARQ